MTTNLFESTILRANWIVLDTETTDLLPNGEICQIGIVNHLGMTLMTKLIKPVAGISPEAARIHHITEEQVLNSPTYADIASDLADIIYGKDVIIYNADFDWKILGHSAEMHNLAFYPHHMRPATVQCAMLWYADHWGEWDDYHGNNRWQRLGVACKQQGVPTGALHGALADAQATYHLILKVMQKKGHDLSKLLP